MNSNNPQSLANEIQAEADELKQYVKWIGYLSSLLPKTLEIKTSDSPFNQIMKDDKDAQMDRIGLEIMKGNVYLIAYNFIERSVRKVLNDFFVELNRSNLPIRISKINDRYVIIYLVYCKWIGLSENIDTLRERLLKPKSLWKNLAKNDDFLNFTMIPNIVIQLPTTGEDVQSFITALIDGKIDGK
jgi:hypothetical protein